MLFFATKERRERKRRDGRASNLPAPKSRSPLPKGAGQGEGEGNVKPAQRTSYQPRCTTGRRPRPRIPHTKAAKGAKEKTGTEGLGPLIAELILRTPGLQRRPDPLNYGP